MIQYRYYIIGASIGLIVRFLRFVGASDAERDVIIQAFGNVMSSFLGDLLLYPLGLMIYLDYSISHIDISLPGWLTELYGFVHNTIMPYWGWLIDNVNRISGVLNNINAAVRDDIWLIVDTAFSYWLASLRFGLYVYNHFGTLLINFLSNPRGYIVSIIDGVLTAALSGFDTLRAFWISVLQPRVVVLTTILSDPVGFFMSILKTQAPDLFTAYKDVVIFLAWWRSVGQSYLVALVNNPVGFILNVIAGEFITWFSNLIADAL